MILSLTSAKILWACDRLVKDTFLRTPEKSGTLRALFGMASCRVGRLPRQPPERVRRIQIQSGRADSETLWRWPVAAFRGPTTESKSRKWRGETNSQSRPAGHDCLLRRFTVSSAAIPASSVHSHPACSTTHVRIGEAVNLPMCDYRPGSPLLASLPSGSSVWVIAFSKNWL